MDYIFELWHAAIGQYMSFESKAMIMLVLWILMGIIFGMASQKWTFVRSLYFAVAAMSTAGLQAVDVRGSDGNIDDSVAWFVAIFCVVGVPIFGLAVGIAANTFVSKLVQGRRQLPPDLSEEDFNEVANLSVDDNIVEFGEFFILEMLRRGTVKKADIDAVKLAYDVIDVDNSGTLTPREVRRFHKICALRRRYAAYLNLHEGMEHDNAVDWVTQMDTEALAKKALKLGWLCKVDLDDPNRPSDSRPLTPHANRAAPDVAIEVAPEES